MFPDLSHYYGLDISTKRLQQAFPRKKRPDTLLLADLCKKLPFSACFDVVVSCNTLSHLPQEQQIIALTSLIDSVKGNGSLFVNLSLSPQIQDVSSLLIASFNNVGYTLTAYSKSDEDSGLVQIQCC